MPDKAIRFQGRIRCMRFTLHTGLSVVLLTAVLTAGSTGIHGGEADDDAGGGASVGQIPIPAHLLPAFSDALPNPAVTTVMPDHGWRPAWIVLNGTAPPRSLRGGFRDGTMAVAGAQSARQKIGELTLSGPQIAGEWSEAEGRITITGTLSGEQVAGAWSMVRAKDGEKIKGVLSGWVRDTAAMATSQAFAADASWPEYLGPNHNKTAGPCARPLVDRLDQSRLLWRSELPIDRGPGNGTPYQRLGKYIAMAFSGPTIAGGSTPVVARSRVFTYHFIPSQTGPYKAEAIKGLRQEAEARLPVRRELAGGSAAGDELDALAGLQVDKDANLPPIEQVDPFAREKYAWFGDDVIACHDAATGALRWTTVLPRATVCAPCQDHKNGPTNCTPCTDGERVYATGTSGRVYACEAATGKLLWNARMPTSGYPRMGGHYIENFNQSPQVVGGTLLVPDHRVTLYGYDASTGALRWTLPGGVGRIAQSTYWRHGDADLLITLRDEKSLVAQGVKAPAAERTITWGSQPVSGTFAAVSISDGKMRWDMPGNYNTGGFALSGDALVVMANLDTSSRENFTCELVCFDLASGVPVKRWATRTSRCKTEVLPVIGDGKVWVSMPSGYTVFDLATGNELARLDAPGGSNEGTAEFVDGRLFTRLEGSHGSGPWTWLSFRDGKLVLATVEDPAQGAKDKNSPDAPAVVWTGVHPLTSSYHSKPMLFPVVDGRMFIRGADGVYCYDLRKP